MARAENTELIDLFDQFYQDYYAKEIGELVQQYPQERRSLYLDWTDLSEYNEDLASDFQPHHDLVREYAEEALRLYDLPVDISLEQAHVRIRNLPDTTPLTQRRRML